MTPYEYHLAIVITICALWRFSWAVSGASRRATVKCVRLLWSRGRAVCLIKEVEGKGLCVLAGGSVYLCVISVLLCSVPGLLLVAAARPGCELRAAGRWWGLSLPSSGAGVRGAESRLSHGEGVWICGGLSKKMQQGLKSKKADSWAVALMCLALIPLQCSCCFHKALLSLTH